MRGPPAVAEQWHCVPVSPASSGPAGRRGFSKQSGGPFARFDSRRITIFKPGTNFRAEVLVGLVGLGVRSWRARRAPRSENLLDRAERDRREAEVLTPLDHRWRRQLES